MAEALIAGAFLSASVQSLMETITSVQFRDFFRKISKLNISLLDELQTTLLTLQAVLNDAEQKQITNPAVKEWLERLKDAVHDAEDLLDGVNTEALRHKVEAQHPHQTTTVKVRNFLCSCCQFHGGVNSKLEALCQRLQRFAAQKSGLGLQPVSMRVSVRAPTSSVANESGVVGRDDHKEKLMSLLLTNDANCNNNIGVITIFGMGGVGKTTLAQLLYNDHRVEEHFDLKAWASVSEVFDVTVVTKSLLESAASKHFENENLNFLQIELRRILKGKKFLLVLDDIWNNKYVEWDVLRTPFSEGKQGSRIIITTRQGDVAQMTHTFPIYHLEPLSDEDCWSLLSKHAFENGDPSRHPNLEVVGRKIAEKCGGLPIAAKTLGGMLRSKVDENEWAYILNSNIWELLNDDVLPALWLSYLYLPPHLKRCFAYCSIFPKAVPLNRKHIVLLWMAEGLLRQGQKKSMEEIGDEYFDELLSRSLIQQDGDDYVMHDLINDLATVVSGRSCNRFESCEISESVRHFSYSRGKYDSSSKFESCYAAAKSLRVFLPLPLTDDPNLWWYWKHYLTKRVTQDFLFRQRYLRVLSLANYSNISELPNSLGNLIHLRFLDLSFTPIKRLPSTVFKLYNLQTLRLLYCQNLTELPAEIENLVNLRHLDMTGTKLKMPRQITTLQNLQTLSTLVVGKQYDGLRLKDLGCFPKLQGKLSILELCNVVDTIDAIEANLKNKELIEELVLDWSSLASQGSQLETQVLDLLQPSTNLRKLTIESYNGTRFPNWLADFSFSNIVFLCVSGCNFCFFLPPLGQLPSLKELYVTRMKMIKTVGPEFYGNCTPSYQPFPSLEVLSFEEMLEWEEWQLFNGEGIEFPFPCLKRLRLYNCPKLKGHLPCQLPSSLTDVNISYCDQLEASTLHWITSTKSLTIIDGGQHLLPILENDSQCLLSYIKIERSDMLTSFPRMVLSSNCLRDLYLTKIPSLTSFPTEGMQTLRTLLVSECKNLEFLPDEAWENYSSLENLMIWDSCDSLICFPLGCFPVLKYLYIWSCPNLESLSISDNAASAQSLSSLEILKISSCPNLESFPQSGLSTPNLMEFKVFNCGKLRSLPEQMYTLNSLQDLEISNIPQLVSFPQGGLPLKLRSVYIGFCKSLSPMAIAKYGFQWLTSLLKIGIGGDDLVHAFLEGNALQHLTSLEEFHILRCQRLESLPEDRLPSSLSLLKIQDCPLLEGRYKNRSGKHMSKISHIPTIRINEEVII